MKTPRIPRTLLVWMTTAALTTSVVLAGPETKSPGAIDLTGLSASASKKGQFVEVRLTPALIQLAARLAADSEPDVARLIAKLQSVHVNVVSLADDNRDKVSDQIVGIRTKLDEDGWERVVTVRDNGADIAVHCRTRGTEAVEGLVVSIMDGGKEAILVNVVGDIQPEELSRIGARLGIDPLKKAGDAVGKRPAGSDQAK